MKASVMGRRVCGPRVALPSLGLLGRARGAADAGRRGPLPAGGGRGRDAVRQFLPAGGGRGRDAVRQEGVLQSLAGLGPVRLERGQHHPHQLVGLWVRLEGEAVPVDVEALDAILDLPHLGRADPVLPCLVIEHAAVEGEAPGEQLVRDDAHGKDIRGGRVLPGVGLAGDVLVGPEDRLRLGRIWLPVLGGVEVDQLHDDRACRLLVVSAAGEKLIVDLHEHDVLEFQVPVNRAALVHDVEGGQQLPHDLLHLGQVADLVRAQGLEEVPARNLLHDDAVGLVVLQDLVDCRHALVDRHVQHELRTHAPVLLTAAAAETLVLPPHFDDDVVPRLLARCEDDLHAAVAGWHDLVAEAVELRHSLDLLDTLQPLLRVNPLLLDLPLVHQTDLDAVDHPGAPGREAQRLWRRDAHRASWAAGAGRRDTRLASAARVPASDELVQHGLPQGPRGAQDALHAVHRECAPDRRQLHVGSSVCVVAHHPAPIAIALPRRALHSVCWNPGACALTS
mmetsp:Transcript_71182/g.153487  ORF Transcript_71182/g.153487 Transcript_71182/m.153487 type:complete len:507 (-) Transcript_71182:9-1529(-)